MLIILFHCQKVVGIVFLILLQFVKNAIAKSITKQFAQVNSNVHKIKEGL